MTTTASETTPARAPGTVAALVGLKARISEILGEALSGYDDKTRRIVSKYRGRGHPCGPIRWGMVERDIHAAIDEANSRTSNP